jgi:hypothetical protein
VSRGGVEGLTASASNSGAKALLSRRFFDAEGVVFDFSPRSTNTCTGEVETAPSSVEPSQSPSRACVPSVVTPSATTTARLTTAIASTQRPR